MTPKSNRAVLDTNVLVRFLTNDVPELAQQAEDLFKSAEPHSLEIPDVVFVELVLVCLSSYAMPKEDVIEKMEAVLSYPAFNLNRALLTATLNYYRNHAISIVDAYLAALADTPEFDRLITFDTRLQRVKA